MGGWKIDASDGMFPGSDGLMVFLVVGVTILHLLLPLQVIGAAGILRFIDVIGGGEIASCLSKFLIVSYFLCLSIP